MKIFQNLREWQHRAEAIRQLRRLPPEILADIGIEPGTEEQAVRGLIARRDVAVRSTDSGRVKPVALAFYPR